MADEGKAPPRAPAPAAPTPAQQKLMQQHALIIMQHQQMLMQQAQQQGLGGFPPPRPGMTYLPAPPGTLPPGFFIAAPVGAGGAAPAVAPPAQLPLQIPSARPPPPGQALLPPPPGGAGTLSQAQAAAAVAAAAQAAVARAAGFAPHMAPQQRGGSSMPAPMLPMPAVPGAAGSAAGSSAAAVAVLPGGSMMLPVNPYGRPPMPPMPSMPAPAPKPAVGEKKKAAAPPGKRRKKRRKEETSSDESDDDDDENYDETSEPAASWQPSQTVETGRPKRQAAADAMVKADKCREVEKASAETFVKEAHNLSLLVQTTSTESTPRKEMQGEYANKFIHIGPDFQAEVAEWVEGAPIVDDCYADGREGDELVTLEYTPLSEPPKPVPILTLQEVKAAEKAEREKADKSAASAKAAEEAAAEQEDFDEDGKPLVPRGVVVGGFCLAMGKRAGEKVQFKAVLVSVRKASPHLLVKYVGTRDGKEAAANKEAALLLPESPRAYLSCSEVEAWVEPKKEPELISLFGLPSAAAERKFRDRPAIKQLELLTEAGGLRLHLDPRRMADGYQGTGYQGVFNDYWPTGYKKLRPYVVTYEGGYAGRFATVEQAAVQYARLQAGDDGA